MPIIHWFRRDLRVRDNACLANATKNSQDGVVPVFIFDDAILRHPDCGGPIVQFMLGCIENLRTSLQKAGGDLIIRHGVPLKELRALIRETGATAVYFNKDYDPAAIERDEEIERSLAIEGIAVKCFKDLVIFEEQEILAASSGEPYTVYSPYRKSWMKKLAAQGGVPIEFDAKPRLSPAARKAKSIPLPTMESLGFTALAGIDIPAGEIAALKMLKAFCARSIGAYQTTRNFPADPNGSSRLSPHLRHGTLSPRQVLRAAFAARKEKENEAGVDAWVGEIVWREFYQQILFNFPHVAAGAFKEKLDRLPWRKDEVQFKWWAKGRTGFPIVDAAMRQLNTTGWMHNRLRMIAAMFLTKDLRIDYKWGERYFANHLIDFETAQNNGGWQWSSSTGTDAQPYFRIFNPASQSKACDPQGVFIRRFVPELQNVPNRYIHAPQEMPQGVQEEARCIVGVDYPKPMIDHTEARINTLAMFKGL